MKTLFFLRRRRSTLRFWFDGHSLTAALLAGALALAAFFSVANAQTLQITSIDASQFPTVKASVYAIDERGRQTSYLSPETCTLVENGVPRAITAVRCPEVPGVLPSLSATLTIDVSGSMQGDGLALARRAAEAFVRGLPLHSECAITAFNDVNMLMTDFTGQKSKLYDAIGRLQANGGTDYTQGLLAEPAGALEISKNGKYKRIAVFLTDGLADTDADRIIETARQLETSIYCVVVGLPAPRALQRIALETGGSCYGNIVSAGQASDIYLMILQHAQSVVPCEIEWQSGASCEAIRRILFSLNNLSWQTETTYKTPEAGLIQLAIKPSGLIFRAPEIGKTQTMTLALTARNASIAVQDIFVGDTTQFSVSPSAFTLAEGETQKVSVRFTPTSSDYSFCQFTPQTDVCRSSSFYAATPADYGENALRTVKLVSPNGGEVLQAGGDTLITWTGVLPQERLIFEYSLDSGASWKRAAAAGKNYSAVWKVPRASSGKALARVSQSPRWKKPRSLEGHSADVFRIFGRPDGSFVSVGQDGSARAWQLDESPAAASCEETQRWAIGATSISAALWSPDNKRLLIAARDGSARFWTRDADSTLPIWKTLRSPILAAAWSPDGKTIALACEDGTITLAESSAGGKTLKTLKAHKSAVLSLAWSPDGERLASGGADNLVCLWNGRSGERLARLDYHRDSVLVLLWSPNSADVFSGAAGATHNAAIWDAEKNAPKYILGQYEPLTEEWLGHRAAVRAATWAYDSVYIVTASDDGAAMRWRVQEPIGEKQANEISAFRYGEQTTLAVQKMPFKKRGSPVPFLPATDILPHGAPISDVYWDKRRQRLLTVGGDHAAIVWAAVDYSDELYEQRETERRVRQMRAAQSVSTQNASTQNASTQSASTQNASTQNAERARELFEAPFEAWDFHAVLFLDDAPTTIATSYDNKYFLFGCQYGKAYAVRSQPVGGQSDTSDNVFSIIAPRLSSGGVFQRYEELSSTEPSLAFFDTPVGVARDSVFAALLSNTSDYAIAIHEVRLADTKDFALVSGANPVVLRPGSAQSLEIRFQPKSAGVKRVKLIVVTSSDTLQTVIEGRAVTPPLKLNVAFVDMGVVGVGNSKDTVVRAAVRNISANPVQIESMTPSGPSAKSFAPANASLPLIPAGGSASVAVRFSPESSGRMSGSVLLAYDGFGSPLELRLFGTGFTPTLKISGRVLDSASGQGLTAIVHWEDAETGEALGESVTDTDGGYRIELPIGKRRYIVRYERRGYYPKSREYAADADRKAQSLTEPPVLLAATPVEEILRRNPASLFSDISFGFNDAVLKQSAYRALNDAASILRQYPEIQALIAGHADALGGEEVNQKLSLARARAVYEYFIGNGCEPRSLTVKSFGSKFPIATNDTEEGRSANRRVEVRYSK